MSLQYVTRKLKTQTLGSNEVDGDRESDVEEDYEGADDEEDVVAEVRTYTLVNTTVETGVLYQDN